MPEDNKSNDSRSVENRRGVLQKLGASVIGVSALSESSFAQGEIGKDDNTCGGCGGGRATCDQVDCVDCSDISSYTDSIQDDNEWRYYEGGTNFSTADYQIIEHIGQSLTYYGCGTNPSNSYYLHEFRFDSYGRARQKNKHESSLSPENSITKQRWEIDEASDRTGGHHALFPGVTNEVQATCPVPDSETQKNIDNLTSAAWTAGSIVTSYMDDSAGRVWKACKLVTTLAGIDGGPESGSDIDYYNDYPYNSYEQPSDCGHYVRFYIETERNFDAHFHTRAKMEGDSSTGTHIEYRASTPDQDPSNYSSSLIKSQQSETVTTQTANGTPYKVIPAKIAKNDSSIPETLRGSGEPVLWFYPDASGTTHSNDVVESSSR